MKIADIASKQRKVSFWKAIKYTYCEIAPTLLILVRAVVILKVCEQHSLLKIHYPDCCYAFAATQTIEFQSDSGSTDYSECVYTFLTHTLLSGEHHKQIWFFSLSFSKKNPIFAN